MSAVTHRFLETNGIRMHAAETGSGAVVSRATPRRLTTTTGRRGTRPRPTLAGA